ncbi:hypothetical protein Hanom_Chr11g01040051 [Helianthus anomalus]
MAFTFVVYLSLILAYMGQFLKPTTESVSTYPFPLKVKMAGSWNRDTCCGCRKPSYYH